MVLPAARLPVAALVLLCAALVISWFLLIGARTLMEPDEGRYAEIPREMLETGDWTTPKMLGFKYFEKPALQYWITAITYQVLGVRPLSARLWPAVAGLLCIAWTGFVAGRLYGREVGLLAAFVCSSTALYVVGAHYLSLDMSLTLFLTIGMGSLALAQQQREDRAHRRRWMLLGWAALAAAVLSKGLVGIALPLLAVVVYSVWQRDWQIWRGLHILAGSVVFLLIAAPWFVKVSMENDEFFRFFFVGEHLQRFLTAKHERTGPIYYFLPVLLVGAIPWLAVQIAGLGRGFRAGEAGVGHFDPTRLLVSYGVSTVVFFSLSSSKLPLYVLPVLPILAVLGGRNLAERGRSRTDGYLLSVVPVVVVGAAWLLRSNLASEQLPGPLIDHLLILVSLAGLLLVVAGIWSLLGPRRSLLVTGAIAVLGISAVQFVLWGVQALAENRSAEGVATLIEHNAGDRPIEVYLTDIWPTYAFYRQDIPTLVGVKGELEMGISADPGRWIPTRERFFQLWRDREEAAVVLKSTRLEKYRPVVADSDLVCQSTRLTVIFKSRQPLAGCLDFGQALTPDPASRRH